MDEPVAEMPTSFVERLMADKRRLALLGVALLAAICLAALFVAQRLGDRDGWDDGATRPPAVIDHPDAPEPSADETSSGSDEPTGTEAGGEGTSGEGGAPGDVSRAPVLAYRFDGAVWVSSEDGTDARRVAVPVDGSFALSPDGRTLAFLNAGRLALVDVADGKRADLGEAAEEGLAWSADSSVLHFVGLAQARSRTQVRRVDRSGGRATEVADGRFPCVSSDGTLVIVPNDGGGFVGGSAPGTLTVIRPDKPARTLATKGMVAACAVAGDRIVYATTGYSGEGPSGTRTDPEIWSMRFDGGDARRLLGKPSSSRPFGYADLLSIEDGTRLLYAEVGDDGYSRAFILEVATGKTVALSGRRDTYPRGWSADGRFAFFIEGNAFQGERTALVRVDALGLGRRTIIDGAGR